ncbi:MAG: S-methyl-5'-thioadenosine phosphorylase [Elusimicrobia bacterium]|nr:S-methyl-5'-thioadenosine phosphorylase [Elusimicrobiota bacterium]
MSRRQRVPPVTIGIIGGSGVYQIEGIQDLRAVQVRTPFGDPSDAVLIGTLRGTRVAFLARHGREHRIPPSEVNARANVYALKSLGVEQLLSISACGSLQETIRPRDIVIPDQLFDRTKGRPASFFGTGLVVHVGFAKPYCPELSRTVAEGARSLGFPCHFGGTYVCIEGPQFSTKAESQVYRSLGFAIIGMTNLPEAKLAREAEMCYTTIGLVTDYDVWKEGEEVNVDSVVANLKANAAAVQRLLKEIVPQVDRVRHCECARALQDAILTPPQGRDPAMVRKLHLFVGKYVKRIKPTHPTRPSRRG